MKVECLFILNLMAVLTLSISCSDNTDNDMVFTQIKTVEENLDYEELQPAALNLSYLDILENCANSLTEEGVNFCGILPDTVEIGGVYIAGLKFVINTENSPSVEPLNSTYEWKTIGKGISTSAVDHQYLIISIDSIFKGGQIEGVIYNQKGGGTIAGALVLKL